MCVLKYTDERKDAHVFVSVCGHASQCACVSECVHTRLRLRLAEIYTSLRAKDIHQWGGEVTFLGAFDEEQKSNYSWHCSAPGHHSHSHDFDDVDDGDDCDVDVGVDDRHGRDRQRGKN